VSVPYRIRRSDRARRIRVSVDGNGDVEVVLPRRSPERHAEQAVRELEGWIERRRHAVARAAIEVGRAPGTVPYLGQVFALVPESGRTRVRRRGDTLLVPEGDPRPALERWYRRQAREEVARRLDAACTRWGSRYTGLTIRAQKTRWASCSSKGAMSFNWRLLLAPPEILDYVVEHEVCHLEVMNHSPRFWRLLASRSPRWREHSAWLRRYGSTLTL
jgi:predicted metal-dependent hydrolase